jgi:hypothetical protein
MEAYPLPNQMAEKVAEKLVNEFIARFGVPLEKLIYQFLSNFFCHLIR